MIRAKLRQDTVSLMIQEKKGIRKNNKNFIFTGLPLSYQERKEEGTDERNEGMRKKYAGLFVLMLIFLISAVCATPAGRSAGEVIDDSTITTEVKSKLLADSFLKGLAISVETFQGQVTLTGAVDTDEQKAKAEKIAMSVKGVKKVNNLLELKKKKK
jgi:hyperosmotically inducible protein